MARWFHVAAPVAAPARLQGGRASQGPSLREEEGPRGRPRLPDEGEEAGEGPRGVPAGGRCRLASDVHHAPASEPYRRRRGDKDIRVVWLSTTLGKDYIDPHNLNSLSNLIANFVTDGPRAVILLDGIEYLMINNDFARILHLLEYVNEQIALHRAAMILSVDERAFDAKELAYIERNTVTLE